MVVTRIVSGILRIKRKVSCGGALKNAFHGVHPNSLNLAIDHHTAADASRCATCACVAMAIMRTLWWVSNRRQPAKTRAT